MRKPMLFVLLVVGCATPRPPPHPIAPTPVPIAPPSSRQVPIEIPEIAVDLSIHHATNIYVYSAPRIGLLEPAATATLATDRTLAHQLAGLVAARAAAVAKYKKLVELVQVQPSDKRTAMRPQVAAAEAALAPHRERLIAALARAPDKLTPDGVVLDAILRAARAMDLHDDAVDHQLDVDPDGPTPVADYRDPRAAIAAGQARGLPAAQRAVLDFAALYLDAQDPDDTVRHTAARAMVPIARANPALAEIAYTIVGQQLYGGRDPDEVAAAVEAVAWLADHAASVDVRGYARYQLGRAQRIAHDRDAIDTLCKVAPPLEPLLVDDAHGEIVRAMFDRAPGDGIDRLTAACAASQPVCPCVPDVVLPLGRALARVERRDEARRVMALPPAAQDPDAACALVQIAADDPGSDRAARATVLADAAAATYGAAWHCDWAAPSELAGGTPARLVRAQFPSRLIDDCEGLQVGGGDRITVELAIAGIAVTHATLVESAVSAAGTACVIDTLARHRWSGLDGRIVRIPIRFE